MRTKLLQLSNGLQVLLVEQIFSGWCNIHLIVSTYTKESVLKRIRNVSTDQEGFHIWSEGKALYGHNTKEKDGD